MSQTHREANFATNTLVNFSHLLPIGLHLFTHPLTPCKSFLWWDIVGVSSPGSLLM